MKSTSAYNLERFEAEEPRERTPRVRVVKNDEHEKRLKRIRFLRARCIFMSIILVGLMVFTVYSHMKLNEVKATIETSKNTLVELQSENEYLNFRLESYVTLDEAEAIAEDKLGLVKVNSSQIEYINLSKENMIVSENTGDESFFSYLFKEITQLIIGD